MRRRSLRRLRLARAIRYHDEDLTIGDAHFERPQPQLRIALMAAGTDIELVAVPRANNIGLGLRENKTTALAVLGYVLLDTRQNLSLADRSTHVRANISVGAELPFDMEDADFGSIDLDYFAAGVGCARPSIY